MNLLGNMSAAALVLLAAIAASATDRHATRFSYERAVIPAAPGPNRLPADVPLLIGARSLRYAFPPAGRDGSATLLGGLEDLRLYDPSGREVAYLVVGPAQPAERWQEGSMLPVRQTPEESGFEIDLGSPLRVDRLRLTGIAAPFLKRVRLEGGGDRQHWAVLLGDSTLFDLPSEGLRHDNLNFAAGEFQYFRVTFNDRNSAPVAPPRAASARVVTPQETRSAVSIPIDFTRETGKPGESRFRLHLPGPTLPIAAFELKCGGGALLRQASVWGSEPAEGSRPPVLLGRATLRRTVRDDLTAADLRIPVQRPEAAELILTVEDRDNPPLELLAVAAELPPLPWIYFESAAGESLTASYGDAQLDPPAYDLEAMRQSFATMQFAEARWGEAREVRPPATEPEPAESPLPLRGAPLDTTAFRYARKLPAGRAGLTALVLDAAVLAHSHNLVDLRIVDADGYQVPYLLEPVDEPLSIELAAPLEVPGSGALTPGQTRYLLALPYDNLPPARLVLTTEARVFSRQVTLSVQRPPSDARSPARTEIITSGEWVHAAPEKPAPPLTLSLPSLHTDSVDLTIIEGDNSSLPIAGPKLLLPGYRIRFIRTDGQELTLLYGQPSLHTPRYDLQLVASRMRGPAANEISLGPEISATTLPPPRSAGIQTTLFWGALVIAVLILLALIARLVAKDRSVSSM